MSGLHANVLVSPGQNRSTGSGLYAQGEPDCSGGNSTGGLNGNAGQPTSCEDGSFATLYSVDLTYDSGPLYVTAAYELRERDLNLALATLCISGGMGMAVVLERA